ncbi:MAG: threonylcarbamoyl-AMP synthase [Clostridia bacterium]|nr:threonylcarbamoyl-AMP synthase [Clostridia bacterium]
MIENLMKEQIEMSTNFKKEDLNDDIIQEVANGLKEGKLVVFPTDTVYGIGTNAYNDNACKKVYEVKGRPMNKPLIVLIANIDMLKEIVNDISQVEQKLIDSLWPGPLTIIFKKKAGIFPDIVSAGDDYIRVRLVNEGIVAKLIQIVGVPVVAPSANLSGSPTGTKIKNIIRELGDKVDYILDYGDIESDTTSTIVKVENERVVVIREGKIKKEELENILTVDGI